jgi:hypothetical protein
MWRYPRQDTQEETVKNLPDHQICSSMHRSRWSYGCASKVLDWSVSGQQAGNVYPTTYQREESPPVRNRLEQHSIEEVVVQETEEFSDEEHGRGVHLQFIALHSKSLDNQSQKCAHRQVNHE